MGQELKLGSYEEALVRLFSNATGSCAWCDRDSQAFPRGPNERRSFGRFNHDMRNVRVSLPPGKKSAQQRQMSCFASPPKALPHANPPEA